MQTQNLEEQRNKAYSKLRTKKKAMDKDWKQFAESRAAYHNALDEYIKIDRELAENNKQELPPKEAPKKRPGKAKSKKEELQELAKRVGREDLLSIINEGEA